jgi:hypothetical protein
MSFMSRPSAPAPAKLIIGFFMADRDLIAQVIRRLTDTFGPPDIISRWFDFDFTRYYEPEMGSRLYRRMTAFKNMIKQSDLSGIKNVTNAIEQEFADKDKRRVNIDPGYMLRERFVLASGKNFSHRIYIGDNIYADLTLIYSKGAFRSLPWTYPDYQSPEMEEFLLRVRSKYVFDLQEAKKTRL